MCSRSSVITPPDRYTSKCADESFRIAAECRREHKHAVKRGTPGQKSRIKEQEHINTNASHNVFIVGMKTPNRATISSYVIVRLPPSVIDTSKDTLTIYVLISGFFLSGTSVTGHDLGPRNIDSLCKCAPAFFLVKSFPYFLMSQIQKSSVIVLRTRKNLHSPNHRGIKRIVFTIQAQIFSEKVTQPF